ncbi:MAG: DUF2752 domain-containing protein [Planctomycetota bacterium]
MIIATAGLSYFIGGVDAVGLLPSRSFCPFKTLTGFRCPGCGMTRAMLSIGQFQPSRAAAFNPLSFPLAAAMLFYLFTGRSWLRQAPFIGWIMLGAVLIFWAARLIGYA